MNQSDYDRDSIRQAKYGILLVLIFVFCEFFKLDYFVIPLFIGWLLLFGRELFFSATFYEDLGRLILSPIRGKYHPSTLVARMRLKQNRIIPEASLDDINMLWLALPDWTKHEVGRHVLRNQFLFARLNLGRNRWGAMILEYFRLLEGVFISGNLQDFREAVKLFEAACYAVATSPNKTSHKDAIEQFLFLNEGTEDQRKFIVSKYPTKWKIENLRLLAEKLSRMPVSSNGKYWLEARIRELESLADADIDPEGWPNLAAVSFREAQMNL